MAVHRQGGIRGREFSNGRTRIGKSARTAICDSVVQCEAIRQAELVVRKPAPSGVGSSPNFAQFAYKEFSPWCANEHRDKPSTYARYMRSIKALAEFFGGIELRQIDSGLVERYKIFRSQQRRKNVRDSRLVSPAAVNRDLAVLRILFNFAIRLGVAKTNPVQGVKFLRENNGHLRVLSAEEEARYLAAASPLLRDVAVVMLETGMRPGEVYRLRKRDVDTELRAVYVREGKTTNARRFIPLTQRACAVLVRRFALVSRNASEWLFPSPFDPSRPIASVRRAHDNAVRRSGVQPRFRLYDLRHTALTRMALSGMDLSTLKELAGHSQIQMTLRYVHPTPEHKRRAIRQFEAYATSQTNPVSPTAQE